MKKKRKTKKQTPNFKEINIQMFSISCITEIQVLTKPVSNHCVLNKISEILKKKKNSRILPSM